MANTYHQMVVQCVFAVKYRQSVIKKEWRSQLMGVMGQLINETGCKTIIVNGVEDHVHCFFSIPPNISVSEVMKVVKGVPLHCQSGGAPPGEKLHEGVR
jgi:REP element-mobilizing transposase RayT